MHLVNMENHRPLNMNTMKSRTSDCRGHALFWYLCTWSGTHLSAAEFGGELRQNPAVPGTRRVKMYDLPQAKWASSFAD